jgi:hypothetical protein
MSPLVRVRRYRAPRPGRWPVLVLFVALVLVIALAVLL